MRGFIYVPARVQAYIHVRSDVRDRRCPLLAPSASSPCLHTRLPSLPPTHGALPFQGEDIPISFEEDLIIIFAQVHAISAMPCSNAIMLIGTIIP